MFGNMVSDVIYFEINAVIKNISEHFQTLALLDWAHSLDCTQIFCNKHAQIEHRLIHCDNFTDYTSLIF